MANKVVNPKPFVSVTGVVAGSVKDVVEEVKTPEPWQTEPLQEEVKDLPKAELKELGKINITVYDNLVPKIEFSGDVTAGIVRFITVKALWRSYRRWQEDKRRK